MDWHSRKVLGWAVSNTMGTELCLEALEKALRSGNKPPEIFKTDQGCQFTSTEWTAHLTQLGIAISMDGRGRWMDNVFIERLWRSVKYEEIYLKEHATIPALTSGLAKWFERYNGWLPHAHLYNLTLHDIYIGKNVTPKVSGQQSTSCIFVIDRASLAKMSVISAAAYDTYATFVASISFGLAALARSLIQ